MKKYVIVCKETVVYQSKPYDSRRAANDECDALEEEDPSPEDGGLTFNSVQERHYYVTEAL